MPGHRSISTSGREPENPSVIRLGAVPYLNVEPLIWGLRSLGDRVRLVPATPRRLAQLLEANEVDAGITPTGHVLESAGRLRIVPGVAIGCDGPVESVLLLSKVAPERIRSLLIDASSMTSALLGQVILRDLHGCAPHAELSAAPVEDARNFLRGPHDALVVIGDAALAAPHEAFPFVVDLGDAWKRLTGLPFVFAVWGARADAPPERLAEIARVLVEAARAGAENIEAVSLDSTARHPFDVARALAYLRDSIRFELGPPQVEAIREFARRVARHRLIPCDAEITLNFIL